MNAAIKSIPVTLVCTLALVFTPGLGFVDQQVIHIKSGNPTNGSLDLSDTGHSYVARFTRITWVIDDNSNVGSIKDIGKKKGSPSIFILAPTRKGSNWTGKVVFVPQLDYQYYITWTEKGNGNSHTYDPKISVKPRPLMFIGLLIIVFAVFFASRFIIIQIEKKYQRK
jgi:hypothetical protein